MRPLVTALLLHLIFYAVGQQSTEALKRSLVGMKGQGKIETLRLVINEIRDSSPLEAIRYAEVLLKEAREQKSEIDELDALLLATNLYSGIGNFKEASSLALEILRKYEQLDSKEDLCSILSRIGNFKTFQGDYGEAFKFLNRAKALATKHDLKELLGGVLRSIGVVYYFQGDFQNSNTFTRQSLAIMEELGNEEGVSDANFYLGVVATKQGRESEALKYLYASFEFTRRDGDPQNIGLSHLAFARLFLRMQEFDKANKHVSIAKSIADSLKLSNLNERLLGLMPLINMALGETRLAVENNEKYVKLTANRSRKKLDEQLSTLRTLQKREIQVTRKEVEDTANTEIEKLKKLNSRYLIAVFGLGGFGFLMLIICFSLNARNVRRKLEIESALATHR